MKRTWIVIALALVANVALAGPIRSRIVTDLNVSRMSDGWDATIHFQVPVRVLRHAPIDGGEQLLVFVELLAVNPNDVPAALQRESLRIPPGARGLLESVTFDGGRAEGPLIEVRFTSAHVAEVATGRDLRSISLHVSPMLATGPVPAPAPVRATDPGDDPTTPEASLLEKGRQAIARGELPLAISYLTAQAADPGHPDAAEALELLGVAREKNGQLAHAKAEYEDYLEQFPDGPGADRVRQRLRALLTSHTSPKPPRRAAGEAFSWERDVDADLTGSMSFTYERAAQLPDGEGEDVTRSVLYSDLHATARLSTRNYTLRGRFSGRLGDDLLDGREARVSSLFGEFSDRNHGVELTFGRQSRSSGGVLGRFDGGHLSVDLPFGVRGHATAGLVVDSSDDFDWEPDRHFYGLSFDLPRFVEKLDTQVYVIRQLAEGMTDRFAIGSEMRYVGTSGFAALYLDFDLHFEALNTAYLVANWRPRERLQLNFLANHRTSPILLTRSSLSGQDAHALRDLTRRFDSDELREIAEDRTARTTNLSLGGTYRISDRLQLAADLSSNYSSGTEDSAGVLGFDSMGWEVSPSLQLIANDVLMSGDLAVATLRHRHEREAETLTASLLTRVPVGPVRVGPSVRLDYRMAEDAADLLVIRPLLRFDFRFRNFVLDAEVGFEWRREQLSGRVDDLGYHSRLSLRRNF